MTSLTYSVITSILGWARQLAAWCWRTITSGKAEGFLAWIGRNWILLTLLLCGIGLAADLCVYILRWQPHKVWRSFFLRLHQENEELPEPEPAQAETSQQEIPASPAEDQLPPRPRKRIQILTDTLHMAAQDDGMDEVTRLATYRPTMKKDHSENFREPVYPAAPSQEDPADHQ